jgi:outer membrane biosynthesis protein TonB
MCEVVEMSDKRMGGMKLGNFSGIKKPPTEPTKPPESTPESTPEVKAEPEVKETETKPVKTTKSEAKVGKKNQAKEQLVTVNIKIRKDQKEWLTDTASTVRDNNTDPVAPSERVYPQHLIGVAIDFLEAAGVDWGEVRNVEELREQLNL